MRSQVIVHGDAALKAIFVKHAECARDPDDVDDDVCAGRCDLRISRWLHHLTLISRNLAGRCEMAWLTQYNSITLEPTYIRDAVVSVPMGIRKPDQREAGDWYITVKAPDDAGASVNFSLIAELVESPVVDEYVAVDSDRAEAELCGRFCVVLPEVDLEEEDALFSHSGAPRRAGVRAAMWSVAAALMLSAAAATLMLGAGGRRVSR